MVYMKIDDVYEDRRRIYIYKGVPPGDMLYLVVLPCSATGVHMIYIYKSYMNSKRGVRSILIRTSVCSFVYDV